MRRELERKREKDSRGTCLHHCPPPSLCSLLCEELEGCRRADAKSDQRRNLSGRNAFVGPLRDEEIEASTSFSLFFFLFFSFFFFWLVELDIGDLSEVLESRLGDTHSDGYTICHLYSSTMKIIRKNFNDYSLKRKLFKKN